MNISKQIKKLHRLLDENARKKNRHRDDLKELLSKLKSKEKHLKEKLKREQDATVRSQLMQEIEMLHTQRKKGVRSLKDIGK